MPNVELNMLKNAIDMQEQLGFKRIKPIRGHGYVSDNSNWLSIRKSAKDVISLAFSFEKSMLVQEGWLSDKIRVNITSNGQIVIFELNPDGDYAISSDKDNNRFECKFTWQEGICKKPYTKERFPVDYVPMNSKGIKRLVLNLPNALVIE